MHIGTGAALIACTLVLGGCGNSLKCALQGDNLKGHVTLAEGVPLASGADVVIEVSSDSFVTAAETVTRENLHALVAVPYSACISNDVDFNVRAFQDINGNGALDAGEFLGLYDGTSDGSGTARTVNLPADETNETWEVEDGVDITLDTES